MVNVELLADQVITGLSIGSRLFLVAVGLSLIFGVLDVLNFTHGVLYGIGAYMSIIAIQNSIGGFWVGILAGAVVVGLVGVALETQFISRVYDRGHLDQLLLTFALVLILTDSMKFIFGVGSKSVNPPSLFRFDIQFTSSLGIPAYRAFVIVMSVVVLIAIFAVLRSTNIGRVVRATSSDRDMARLLGINVSRLYTGVFFVGAALAGLGGAMAAPLQSVTPELGNQVIINAFVVVVIGGLGSFTGAFVGAYLIGLMWAVGTMYVSGAGQLMPFVAMIIVLLVKPEGLFGGAET